ncbi:two-component sensor histidine kinase [Actinomadura sp. WAC 06369]|nr:two-component sensor histidine kinase [Actinomadura sp. WAC 06369]
MRGDVLVAAVLLSANLARIPHVLSLHPAEPDWTIALAYLLACVDLLAIAVRRYHPAAALAAATAAPLATAALPVRPALIGIGILFCAYTVAVRTSWPRAATIVGAACAAHLAGGLAAVAAGGSVDGLVAFWGGAPRDAWTMATGAAAAYLVPAMAGLTVRTRRVHRAETAARIERDREEQAAAAVAEERARIARELHDIAAHDLSAIVVQAGAADRLLDRDPEAVRATLRSIRAQGRDTLTALRTMVGLMREHDRDADVRAPQPTAARLEEVVRQSRDTGMAVEFRTTGAPRRLPLTVDLAVSRLVQEALANAREHAPGAPVTVETAFGDASLRVTVRNAEPDRPSGPSGPGRGHGLLGMRERVQHAGGELRTGPRPDGGWQVAATFPLDQAGER